MSNKDYMFIIFIAVFQNIVDIVCFTILAVIFNKWWLILCSALFWKTFTIKTGENEDE